jgi:hypothetical protein
LLSQAAAVVVVDGPAVQVVQVVVEPLTQMLQMETTAVQVKLHLVQAAEYPLVVVVLVQREVHQVLRDQDHPAVMVVMAMQLAVVAVVAVTLALVAVVVTTILVVPMAPAVAVALLTLIQVF